MSRQEYKARDKITQKISRDGLVERNAATGEEQRVSKRSVDFKLHGQEQPKATIKKDGSCQKVDYRRRGQVAPENVKEQNDTAPVAEQRIGRHEAAIKPVTGESSPIRGKTDDVRNKAVYRRHRADNDSVATTVDTVAEADRAAFTQPPKTGNSPKSNHPGRLQFSKDEAAPFVISKNKKLAKAERQMERTNSKLEKARDKLPVERKLRVERVFDEKSGTTKQRLYFEKNVKSQSEHLKGALPLRPVRAAGNSALAFGHRKIYQVEHENVGTQAAHKGELLAESGVRSALRFRKTSPYRMVSKLERTAAKKTVKLSYQRTLADNPKLKSNAISRMWQKRKIKKEYAKAAREAHKAAQHIRNASSLTGRAAQAVAGVVRRHPMVSVVLAMLSLLLFFFISVFGLTSAVGDGSLQAILTASYLAEDADIDDAEIAYTEWETDLKIHVSNVQSSRPGYDEYIFSIGEISHNPYELMAYLTATAQNFSYDAIVAHLRVLFNEQYTLTFTVSIETRYADPTDADDDGDYEPYSWRILTTTLTSMPFNSVAFFKMDADQRQHYSVLIESKGSRQYLESPFDINWLPYVSSYYGWRIHPISGAKDLHRGVDIGLPTGTEIHSGQDGMVTFAGYSGDYGYIVIVDDGKGLVSKYAHCDTLLIAEGQAVLVGEVIATVGNTGSSTGAHLHLEIIKDGQYLNPLFFAVTNDHSAGPSYGNPGAPMGDGTYAAMLAEAEKYIGYPYVWGGSTPQQSFDCSGYICWIINQSGAGSVGRTTAQGLYNLCTPISPSDARPGDIIFFQGTYSTTDTVTHVGLYVGGEMMLHAGNPIGYVNYVTRYGSHFYSFGRLS